MKPARRLGFVAVAILAGCATLIPQATRAGADDAYEKIDVFAQVLQYVQNSYVDDVESRKLIYGAIRGMLSFSTAGLKIPLILGVLIISIVLLYLGVAVALHFLEIKPLDPGWTSLVVILTLGMGLQFVFLGITGLYVGRIFIEVKQRPAYFIEHKLGE